MPGGDEKETKGTGPGTTRGAGYCAGFSVPGYMNPVSGRRFFARPCRGFSGRGRGYRHWFYATGLPFLARVSPYMYGSQSFYGEPQPYGPQMTKEMEIDLLKREAEDLEIALKEIKDRLAKLTEEK